MLDLGRGSWSGWTFVAAFCLAACWTATGAAAAETSASVPAKKRDAVSYCEIRDLRTKLCLTNDVLAAMGLTEGEARAVLGTLIAWHGDRKADREAVDVRKRKAEKDLRDAEQKVHMGPRDEALMAQIPGLKKEHEAALKAESDLQETSAAEVCKLLTQPQISIWETARKNKLAEPYRYAPNVTPEQEKDLVRAGQGMAMKPSDVKTAEDAKKFQSQMQEARDKVFTSSQLECVKLAMDNKRKCMAGVFKASEAVLPLPDDLKPHPIAASTVPAPAVKDVAKN